ncbi:myrosinase 1-like [Aricia agestis]|uniref:myrosinase 1-like n=1 Tax=Aricia agestis TaxID=91739 RepID=UPI001C208BB5|nr:myrosinase 1-like [Aricia agestis]
MLFLFLLSSFVFKGNADTIGLNVSAGPKQNYTFPKDFLFGVSTAALQIEGAWDADGKGESIWDHLVHVQNPKFAKDGSTPDVAADSYHNYKRDAEMVHELGVNIYRFSISWPRIMPKGLKNDINQKGLEYYRNLLMELEKYNVTAMVVMYHWDLPQALQEMGGWTNENIVDYFADYAKVLYDNYADKVKYWVTFNEPMQVCLEGYGNTYRAPKLNQTGFADYLCTHNLLKAHAKAYHIYNTTYRPTYGGQVAISLDSNWAEPKTESASDREAAERYLQFHLGWYTHPIYSAEGNYPAEMIRIIDEKSRQQNFSQSRLPKFTPEEIEYIKGTGDFFGLNHYTTYYLTMADKQVGAVPSHANDCGIVRFQNPKWPSKSSSNWLRVVPVGFRRLLKWVSNEYNNVSILVTENGFADFSGVHDAERVSYYGHYLNALLHSMYEDKTNVKGYCAWSLMDNWEWDDGLTSRFGLFLVDFKSPNKTRTPKDSAKMYAKVIKSRSLPDNFDPTDFSAFSSSNVLLPSVLTVVTLLSLT